MSQQREGRDREPPLEGVDHLLRAAEVALIQLDQDLRTVRITASAEALFGLRDVRRRRSLAELALELGAPGLTADVEEALRSGGPVERALEGPGGEPTHAKTAAIVDAEGQVSGVVITFTDPSARRALEAAERRQDALLASLLFSGPGGVAEAELFARVYGFPYVRELHARVFGVLLHRVRKEVETIQIERVDGVCRATHDRAVCLPDPDASLQLEERLLRWIAREGRQEARRVAEELDVPLRSAQAVLQALVEDGALVRERAGRSFSYRVEDTTFQEPTSA